MARIRTIKPEFFKHEELFDLEQETGLPLRVAFAGLWTVADREGRFRWRPRTLKSDVLPFDEVDFSRVLDALATGGFVVRYASAGDDYGHIPSWAGHQMINGRERESILPAPAETRKKGPVDACSTRDDALTELEVHAPGERKGKERKGKEGNRNHARTEPPTDDDIDAIEEALPASGHGSNRMALTRNVRNAYMRGHSVVAMLGKAHEYRQHIESLGVAGTDRVKAKHNFFADDFFTGNFPVVKSRTEQRMDEHGEALTGALRELDER